jgi:16S rRNA (uracil1498-N3)-methyltransferase
MRSPRLHVAAGLSADAVIAITDDQARHVQSVLRLEAGALVSLFNAADGEWQGALEPLGKRGAAVRLRVQLRPPEPIGDLTLMFAPVKRQATDWIIEKATELGATRLIPVITRRTIVETVRLDRWRAITIEAAEQCERLDLPEISAPQPLAAALAHWPTDKPLLFADEQGGPPLSTTIAGAAVKPTALLVGPEGGFDPSERTTLHSLDFVRPFSFGRRILRAETAAIAGLALLGAANME